MPKYRRARINDEVARVLADALRNVKDHRIRDQIITITSCDVSGDLRFAKVYFSVYGADHETIKEIKKGLYSAQGFLRHALAEEINLRITPELTFEYDNAMERGAHISELLKKASIPEELESDLEDAEGEESDDDEEQ
ncbi:MAG: 30S ribosome-binding factor RbfA [Clostridia bacterium]|jgi:ribosome-binding factor A|nr:30S ribosome-binding factor RbfA [Clostridia bacterium]